MLIMGKSKRRVLLPVILYFQLELFSNGQRQEHRTCAKHFSRSGGPLPTRAEECSMEALLQSSAVNRTEYDSLALTTADMATNCRAGGPLEPTYAREGSLTFSSTDRPFQTGRPAGSSLCIHLRGMPHTFFQIQAESIQGWMKSESGVEVGFEGERFFQLSELTKGMTLRSDSSDAVLVVHGLWERFQSSASEMVLRLTIHTEPECMEEQLQVKCPRRGFAWTEADVAFILDSSASVHPSDFDRMKMFMTDILEMADIDSGNVRVAAITYGRESHIEMDLDSYQTKTDVFAAIADIPHLPGLMTNTGDALHTVRTAVFTVAKGDRPLVANVAILLTDGQSQDRGRTWREAEEARARGIQIYAIGIGQDVEIHELNHIASEPLDQHRFVIQDFDDLGHLRDHFFSTLYPGHIQTYNWNGATQYQPSTDACVTVEAPADQVIMVSFVLLDLQVCHDCQCDRVQIHLSSACRGAPESVLCDSAEARPQVYQTDVISVRFKSDAHDERAGFRLLFSFHSSATPPQRLRNGRWVCSGDEGRVLVLHFICSFDTFCLNAEDKAALCPPSNLCGDSSFGIGGRCYRYVRPDRKVTWTEASESCQGNGGHLVSLNTEQEWGTVAEFWGHVLKTDYLMVGLRSSGNLQMPDLYSFLLRWNDGTVAYYLNISHPSDFVLSTDTCAAFHAQQQHLSFVSCNLPLRANYLCEMASRTSRAVEPKEQSKVTLPSPSTKVSNLPQMSECPNGDVTLTWLQCDRSSRCYGDAESDVTECLRQNRRVAETMFTCRDENQLVHYSLVCDHRRDCEDGSDEDFCVFAPCLKGEFSCRENGQCVPQDFRCDGVYQCVDRSDEERCWASMDSFRSNTVLPPAVVRLRPAGGMDVTALSISRSDPVCPDTHFRCPGDGYCLPVFVRCNGVSDCPAGEDETDCGSFQCPGFYRCHGADICLHADHLCDGESQCPRQDDELMCPLTCPEDCTCTGFAFDCSRNFSADAYPQLRYLRADFTGMTLRGVAQNSKLIYLSLRHCEIKEIGGVRLPNLQTLDLSYNSLTSFTDIKLGEMNNLRSLSLAFNALLSLNAIDYMDKPLPGVLYLDMSGSNTHEISNISFVLFPNIERLNLSGSQLQTVLEPGFSALHQLKALDLSGCPVTEFHGEMFRNLSTLEQIYTSVFHMCCPSVLPGSVDTENCHAPSDEVSSCAALLRENIFRVFLVIYALFALLGNAASFSYRVFGKGVSAKLGFDIFVTHLCVSDFLMGVYLTIVGIADRVYYGNYEWNATQWKHSVACQMAGFLSFLSSEVSAFLICLITLERFLGIRFPLRNLRFSPKSAQTACALAWGVGVLLAAIPLLPFSPPWDFYSQTGICIPLPVTRKAFPGSEYSFLVMIVFNFILFLLIAAGQCMIFWSIRSQRKAISSVNKTANDTAVARRLLLVVMSDFLCWFPIGLLGLLARSGTPISGDINVAMAIFVLPFNSAFNPFLYTFHALFEGYCVANKRPKAEGKGNKVPGICSTCGSLKQSLSDNTSPLMKTERQRSGAGAAKEGTSHDEFLTLIDTILQEKLMTAEELKCVLRQPIRNSSSSPAAEIHQT